MDHSATNEETLTGYHWPMSNPVYDPEHYDEHLTLKVPTALWLSMAFQVRHLLLLGITFMPTTGEEITVLRDLVRPEYLLADLLALPVLLVAIRRRPEAPDWMRQAWPWGRSLLLVSALTYVALLGWNLIGSGRPLVSAIDELSLISLLATLGVVVFLARSPLVRDLFREFPPAP